MISHLLYFLFEIRPEHAPGAFERGDHRKYIERRNCQKDRGSVGEQEKDLSGRTAGVCQKPEIEGSHDQSRSGVCEGSGALYRSAL